MRAKPATKQRPSRAAVARPGRAPIPWIVGIGASTGGLKAFSELLAALELDNGAAVVLVQHLAPTHKSLLTRLLSAKTQLAVVEAGDGMVLRANRVVVIPPSAELTVAKGRLHLVPRRRGPGTPRPIDVFFQSLAQGCEGRCIAIVLSGAGTDGSQGLRAVRAAGGITMAQDPATAECSDMPVAAIETGAVDFVLAPAAIGVKIGQLEKMSPAAIHHLAGRRRDATAPGLDPLTAILEAVRRHSGVDFSHYKRPTVLRRLQRRMRVHQITTIAAYCRLLGGRPEEVGELFRDLLIHVTSFFRDRPVFDALSSELLPRLLAQRADDVPLRIWAPGCATGEEAYSLAMCLIESMETAKKTVPVRVFATDVSESAIETARAGLYPPSIAADVSPERLNRFFTRVDGHYRVTKAVRDLCIFARHDVSRDPPFSRLDLILCRNLLIYLDAPLQRRLLTAFHYSLKPGGVLVLGAAESIGAQTGEFGLVDALHRIFVRKPSDAVVVASMRWPPPISPLTLLTPLNPLTPADACEVPGLSERADALILARFAPAGAIVDADGRIVNFRGATGNYLEAPSGEVTLDLLKMVRSGLLRGTRDALLEARRTGLAAERSALLVEKRCRVKVVVLPMAPPGPNCHRLVLFEDGAIDSKASGRRKLAASELRRVVGSTELISQLRNELAASRDYLQTIQNDFEAAHEELQSANEEILSNNEELQSANEELDTAKEQTQSSNEELRSANNELRARVDELTRSGRDLIDLVACGSTAAFVVDAELRVICFTPSAKELLDLVPANVGQALVAVVASLALPELESRLLAVIDGGAPFVGSVRDAKGRPFTLHLQPRLDPNGEITGAIMILAGTSLAIHDGSRLPAPQTLVDRLFAMSREPLALLDGDLRLLRFNAAFVAALKLPPLDVASPLAARLADGTARKQLGELLQADAPSGTADITLDAASGEESVLLRATRFRADDASPNLLLELARAGGAS